MNPADISIQVADAVVTDLAAGVLAGTFSLEFAPQRTYDTDLKLEDNATLRVDVLYGDPVLARDTRTEWKLTIPIDICIRQQCAASDATTADNLAKLAGEIWQYFADTDGTPRALTSYTEATMADPEDVESPISLYLPDVLREHNQFTAIVRLEYEVAAE